MGVFFKNATWSAGVTAVRVFFGFLNALMAVRLLGAQQYGLLATLLAFFMLYVGFSNSLNTVLVARLMAPDTEQPSLRSQVLAAAAVLNACALVTLAFITLGAYWLFPRVMDVNDLLASGGWRRILMLLGCVTALQISSALQSAVIESSGRLDLAMKAQLLGPFSLAAILAGCFILHVQLSAAGYLSVLCIAFGMDLLVLFLVRWQLLRLKVIHAGTRPSLYGVKSLLISGGMLQAASLMNVFLEPLNKFLLNHFIGPVAVTSYDLAMKVIWGIQGLFGAAMRPFLHIAHQDGDSVGQICARAIGLIVVPVVIIHVLGGIMLIWVSREGVNIHSWQLFAFYEVAMISNVMMIAATPLYTGLIGRNDVTFVFRVQIVLAFTNLLSSLLLIPRLGLIGAALGLFVACLINIYAVYRRHVALFGYRTDWHTAFGEKGLRLGLFFGLSLVIAATGGFMSSMELPLMLVGLALVVMLVREPLAIEMLRRVRSGLDKPPGRSAR